MEHARKKKIKKWQILLLIAAALVIIMIIVLLAVWQGSRFSTRETGGGFSSSTPSLVGEVQPEVSSAVESAPEQAVASGVTPTEPAESQVSSSTEESTVSAAAQPEPETGYRIANFPLVYQLPELQTGCEITALTMVLQYYGLDAEKAEMASDYLPTSPSTNRHTGSDGLLYGVDLDAYFVGSPFDDSGMVCGPQAIVTAANDFLADQGSSLQAVDYTGATPEELYALVDQNTPVVVWATIGMTPRQEAWGGWYTESGKYVDWTGNDHCAVLVGYSDTWVWIADPLAGLVRYNKAAFESVFASRSNRCVALQ